MDVIERVQMCCPGEMQGLGADVGGGRGAGGQLHAVLQPQLRAQPGGAAGVVGAPQPHPGQVLLLRLPQHQARTAAHVRSLTPETLISEPLSVAMPNIFS